jgi:hypothetical protein
MITIGRCWTCQYRNHKGYCTNPKLAEDEGQTETADMLIYSFSEGGGFFVGPNFGCVHYVANQYSVKPENNQE